MSDSNAEHPKRVATIKEHLAGVKAAATWAQTIVANDLEHGSIVYDQAKQSLSNDSGQPTAQETTP